MLIRLLRSHAERIIAATRTASLSTDKRNRRLNEPVSAIKGSKPWTRLAERIMSTSYASTNRFSGFDGSAGASTDVGEDVCFSSTPSTSRRTTAKATASASESSRFDYYDGSFTISNLRPVSLKCILQLVETSALDNSVLRVSIQTRPRIYNFEVRGIVQSGVRFHEPYGDAGLDGEGQILGIADSGLNDLSCFFLDDSNAYSGIVTNRTGVLEPLRRKVIQYSFSGDVSDDEGGHGTHVAGTAVGFSSGESSANNGIAPAAKVAFFDVGECQLIMFSRVFLTR